MRRTRIDPGALRVLFVLEEASPVADGAGGHSETWAEVASFFGRIEPVSARSRFGAMQANETVTHVVGLRHRDDIRSGMRLRSAGRVFSIATVHDPDETGRYLECLVTEEGQ